jgi:uroporphyrinogen-III decarboxylase
MMSMVALQPRLVEHACRRYLQRDRRSIRRLAALGVRVVWIEECMTDMLSPRSFASLNLPMVRQIVAEIRRAGLWSICYFCGNPAGKWDSLFAAGADALALEESKKGFSIDIEEVVCRAQGRCTVLGNLDAVGILQDGSDDQLRGEVARQLAAGRRNQGRFIMSLGSPVTPGTPVGRVRQYCDLVHEMSRG